MGKGLNLQAPFAIKTQTCFFYYTIEGATGINVSIFIKILITSHKILQEGAIFVSLKFGFVSIYIDTSGVMHPVLPQLPMTEQIVFLYLGTCARFVLF